MSSILLACMALIVSVKTCEVAELQNDLTAIAYLPHLTIESHLERNEQTGVYDRESITIQNTGYDISEVYCEYKTYFTLTLTPKDPQANQIRLTLPVVGYFNITHPTNSSTGLLFTITPDFENNSKMGFLQLSTRQIVLSRFQFHDLELVRLVKVSYRNKLGTRVSQYYKVDSVNGGREITQGEYLNYEASAMAWRADIHQFEDITAKDLEDIILKQ
jgi:hypothetical protein